MSRLWAYLMIGTLCATLLAVAASAQPPVEHLPEILQLQIDQQPAWRAYRDAVAETQADGAHDAGFATQLNAMTTPQRLNVLRDQLRVQQQGFERQAAATQAFYATLSPQQRHLFDDVTRLPAGRDLGRSSPHDQRPTPQTLRVPPAQAGLPPLAPGSRP